MSKTSVERIKFYIKIILLSSHFCIEFSDLQDFDIVSINDR